MFFISGFSLIYINVNIIIVCTPAFLLGGLNLLPNSQEAGAWQDLNFERGLLENRGVTNITKKSNWQILTKNLVKF